WLSKKDGNEDLAQCSLCKTDLKAHKKSLIDHTETAKHKSRVSDSVVAHNCRSIKDFDQKAIDDTGSTELKISMFVAERTSLNCVDHLGIMLKGLCATNTNCHLSNIKNYLLLLLLLPMPFIQGIATDGASVKSSKCQSELREIYQSLFDKVPLKFVQNAPTQWLS
uniref:BED-type domain-containing protein n=1 Tax=Romanomermis culicivorax TaxID=13658 RepID=A0A915JBM1_ROMCU